MSRLTPIEPAEATGDVKTAFDGPLKGAHFNVFKGLAVAPAALQGYLAISGALAKGTLSAEQRELIQLAIAQANSCDYCLAAHTAIAGKQHISNDRILEARRGRSSDPSVHALIQFALALHEKRGRVSDADIDAFRKAGFNDGHVAEVVANYALATFTNYFNHVNDTPVDFPPAPAI